MKNHPLSRFIAGIAIISLIIVAIGFIVFSTILKNQYLPVFIFLLAFFILVTTSFHSMLIKVSKLNPSKFINRFMMFTGIKLLLYALLLGVYLLYKPENAASFLVAFLFLYLVFTAFEVVSIVRFLKK